jgi:hypothetical protein
MRKTPVGVLRWVPNHNGTVSPPYSLAIDLKHASLLHPIVWFVLHALDDIEDRAKTLFESCALGLGTLPEDLPTASNRSIRSSCGDSVYWLNPLRID